MHFEIANIVKKVSKENGKKTIFFDFDQKKKNDVHATRQATAHRVNMGGTKGRRARDAINGMGTMVFRE